METIGQLQQIICDMAKEYDFYCICDNNELHISSDIEFAEYIPAITIVMSENETVDIEIIVDYGDSIEKTLEFTDYEVIGQETYNIFSLAKEILKYK